MGGRRTTDEEGHELEEGDQIVGEGEVGKVGEGCLGWEPKCHGSHGEKIAGLWFEWVGGWVGGRRR